MNLNDQDICANRQIEPFPHTTGKRSDIVKMAKISYRTQDIIAAIYGSSDASSGMNHSLSVRHKKRFPDLVVLNLPHLGQRAVSEIGDCPPGGL